MLAWFNPELPEILAVTDVNRENCFTVERAEDVPAMDAPAEVLGREQARVAAHNGYAAQRYRTLARIAGLNARPTLMDRDTAKLGQAIEEQQDVTLAAREKRSKRATESTKAFNRLGYTPRADESVTDRQLAAANELNQLLGEETP